MSMMSEIQAAMAESGEIARVEKLRARADELEGQIAAEEDVAWRATYRRSRRLALQEIDRITGLYALRVARVGSVT